MGPIKAIKYDEKRERKIWFNNIAVVCTTSMEEGFDLSTGVTFGDGTPLPIEAVQDCVKFMEEESAALPWEQGDVFLIENLAALHSRNSFTHGTPSLHLAGS
ncbi:hypothetical protein M569_06919 [Genlisea aurea]|uniref:TauD/TfdA-like domain-containing protein n=1 Tax=Genlisea aurea TaxID=192259 RepID=S8DX72_9LAMI|nr:hypothetical protein M569_06919 [Genlisea aurea]